MPLESDLDRPIEHRATARVIVLDPDDHVLLLQDSDPVAPGVPTFWITPGGGIEDGETPPQAAARELHEEVGLTVAPDALTGPIAERTVVHGYGDKIAIQTETFFVVTTEHFDVTPVALTDEEVLTLVGARWWPAAEVRRSAARIWPAGMSALLDAVHAPSRWPVELSAAEESTVPVGTDIS